MVTVGRVDQRTHVHVKRGYFRLRTDGRTDGQPENIMPPVPKGGGIKKSFNKTQLKMLSAKCWPVCSRVNISSNLAHMFKMWLPQRGDRCRQFPGNRRCQAILACRMSHSIKPNYWGGVSQVGVTQGNHVNSLVPERCGSNFTSVFLNLILWIHILSLSYDTGLRWVPQNLLAIFGDKSTLVQVMAWCSQATSHYLS